MSEMLATATSRDTAPPDSKRLWHPPQEVPAGRHGWYLHGQAACAARHPTHPTFLSLTDNAPPWLLPD